MNITFLIGNGFDLNLGLATAYSDFVKYYKETDAEKNVLIKFRQDISDNEAHWSAEKLKWVGIRERSKQAKARRFQSATPIFVNTLLPI